MCRKVIDEYRWSIAKYRSKETVTTFQSKAIHRWGDELHVERGLCGHRENRTARVPEENLCAWVNLACSNGVEKPRKGFAGIS